MRAICHEMMLPSLSQNKIGTSELDPFRSSILGPWSPPVNASRRPSRDAAHHSGSGRLARPSPWGTFTSYSLPASWRTPKWVKSDVSTVGQSLPVYPQLRTWRCTAITDAMCQIRKSARTGGTRTDRIADITGRQFRASSSFPTQKKPDAKKFQQQFAEVRELSTTGFIRTKGSQWRKFE